MSAFETSGGMQGSHIHVLVCKFQHLKQIESITLVDIRLRGKYRLISMGVRHQIIVEEFRADVHAEITTGCCEKEGIASTNFVRQEINRTTTARGGAEEVGERSLPLLVIVHGLDMIRCNYWLR